MKPPASTITLDFYEKEIGKTGRFKLATHVPGNTASATRKFSTSNSSVCVVFSDGMVYAEKPGTAYITAETFNGKKATCKVTVIDDSSVSVEIPTEYRMDLTHYVKSVKNYQNGSWSSSDTSIATVDSNGKMNTYKKTGPCTVKYKAPSGVVIDINVYVLIRVGVYVTRIEDSTIYNICTVEIVNNTPKILTYVEFDIHTITEDIILKPSIVFLMTTFGKNHQKQADTLSISFPKKQR